MRTRALARRILHQMRRDRRTLALMFFAPLLLLSLVFLLLNSTTATVRIAIISAPEAYVERLYENNTIPMRMEAGEARRALEAGEVTAILEAVGGRYDILIDGSNSDKTRLALLAIEAAKRDPHATATGPSGAPVVNLPRSSDITYLYGYEDLSAFDHFGSVLIGILVFFFVFIVAGISFLQERTSGTLEKLLSTPIRRWEIVAGYTLGYGVVTVLQSILVSLFVVYVLGVILVGSLWLVLLVTLLAAVSALTLGILLSTAANNEFQMMQFIPVVITPQIFLSGLFELSPFWTGVGKLTPVYYVAHALNEVMIRGSGISVIWIDLLALTGYCALFMAINVLLLRKHRTI